MSTIHPDDVRWVRQRLLVWFNKQGRRFHWREPTATIYEIVIAEILLQRTTAPAVASVLPTFLEHFPTWASISQSSVEEIGQVLKPLGLWRRRALTLHALACRMATCEGRFPGTRSELEALPGIGQYIASSILLFAHGKREPLLDVNMARVLERVFGPRKLADIRYDPYLQSLAKAVVASKDAQRINWAFLDLGAAICRPSNTLCHVCPLLARCRCGLARTEVELATYKKVAEKKGK